MHQRLVEERGQQADTLPGSSLELDEESIERLEALGYVAPSSGLGGTARAGPGPDPTQMVATLTEMMLLSTGLEQERAAPAWMRPILAASDKALPRDENELLEAYEEFAEAKPDFAPVYKELELLYKRSGRTADAQTARRRFESLVRPEP